MFLKSMTTPLLLFAYGVSAIRRHPGVDDKFEFFSDAVKRVRNQKGSMVFSSRFEKLLQEWEGSSWTASADFNKVVVQIESDLIGEINDQHTIEQEKIDKQMGELTCKDILVSNAHSAALSADSDANAAVTAEKGAAASLVRSLTKLKNLDLIRHRSYVKRSIVEYSYPGELGADLQSFDCKFDEKNDTKNNNCDFEFNKYEASAQADVKKVEDHLGLEQSTWTGFEEEERLLQLEQDLSLGDAKTSYDEWVRLNKLTRDAWIVRQDHICDKSGGEMAYGLVDYTDVLVVNQVCAQQDGVPISYQRQHTDFCKLETSMKQLNTTLKTANTAGSEIDQQYEIQVLNQILCILNRLDIAESNLTETNVALLVSECETKASQDTVLQPYIFDCKAGFDCKARTATAAADGEVFSTTDKDWCFTSFCADPSDPLVAAQAGVTELTSLATLTVGTEISPSCENVVNGAHSTYFSRKMHFRWRFSLSSVSWHPLQAEDCWHKTQAEFCGTDQPSGLGFLRDDTQDTFNVWAAVDDTFDCTWVIADLSGTTGFESKLSSAQDKKCAIPEVREYLEINENTPFEDTNNDRVVGYRLDGTDYDHFSEQIISQCKHRGD